jgi:hypothetical protein
MELLGEDAITVIADERSLTSIVNTLNTSSPTLVATLLMQLLTSYGEEACAKRYGRNLVDAIPACEKWQLVRQLTTEPISYRYKDNPIKQDDFLCPYGRAA